jgi:hypothetical protein
VNLRTQFLRILDKAGIEPWPKLFQNLRSSRQTELTETWPAHVVCAWIGNSEVIARDHYLQITDDHFAAAAGVKEETGGAESGAASARLASHHVRTINLQAQRLPQVTTRCGMMRNSARMNQWAIQGSNL